MCWAVFGPQKNQPNGEDKNGGNPRDFNHFNLETVEHVPIFGLVVSIVFFFLKG